MAIFSTVLTLLVMAIPETHGPTILKQKLKREGLSPPAPSRQEVIAVFKTSMARPMLYLFTEPVVMFVSLYLAGELRIGRRKDNLEKHARARLADINLRPAPSLVRDLVRVL